MASTFYQDYNQNTPVVSAWLNDINKGIYSAGGIPRTALQIPVAWVRFNVVAGVVSIVQSSGITSVVRTAPGVYTVNYSAPLTNAQNSYEITQNLPGFVSFGAETISSVVVNVANTANVGTDPGACSVTIYGAN